MNPSIYSLPNVPSDVLVAALNDLEAVEKMPEITINMGTWLTKKVGPEGRQCEVCHAGAVMVNRVGLDSLPYRRLSSGHTVAMPDDFDHPTAAKLNFINEVRVGNIAVALHYAIRFVPRDLADRADAALRRTEREQNEFGQTGVYKEVQTYQPAFRDEYKDYIRNVIEFLKAEGL